MMKTKTVNGIRVEQGSGNVYADLGCADSGAMLVKAKLVAKIAEIIESKKMTQTEAGRLLGLTQPKVSALLRGQFRGVSERRLLDCLTRLGRDVQIVVRLAPRTRDSGRLTVLFT